MITMKKMISLFTRYEVMDSGSNCKVDVKERRDGEISISYKNSCLEFCGAGAELRVEGLSKQ
jgi:hypothetical protein